MRTLARTLAIGCALGLALGAAADGLIVVRPTPVQRRQGIRNFPLEVKFHRVKTTITDQVAVTAIDQVFHNPTSFRLEGTYVFPVPRGAAISRFSMNIDGQQVKGEILEKDKARQIYESIVRRSQDPALMEYVGTKLVKLRIFPIEPRSDKRIKISYSEVLEGEGGLVSYRYPLNTEKFSAKPLDEVSVEVAISGVGGIRSVYSPTHPVTVTPQGKSVTVRYAARNVTPHRDFLLTYMRSKSAVGLSAMTYKRSPGASGHFGMVISPPLEFSKSDILPQDVVFVLDTSGSMLNGDKIGQARKALAYCLGRLSEKDRFAVVDFSTEVRHFAKGLTPVDKASRKRALAYVQELDARGGTNINEALLAASALTAQAKAGRPFTVIFITDGRPTIGERRMDAILKNLEGGGKRFFRLFSIGVGHKINTHLLDRLSSKRRGTTLYVGPKEDLEIKISAFFDKFAYPVMTDLKLSVDGVRIRDVYPRPLPDLFKGSQLVLFGSYKGKGEQPITLEGTYRGERRKFVFEASFADGPTAHDYLPHLWAKRKVGHLLDQIRLHGQNEEIKGEIVRLAKRYGIMTPYTSFLVLEDERQRSRPDPTRPQARAPRPGAASRFFGGKKGENLARGADQAMKQQSGGRAIEAAKESKKLKNESRMDSDDKVGGGGGADGGSRLRRVGEKTFYRQGSRWVDSAYDAETMAKKRVAVTYLSKAYFELLGKHPEIGPYLALGKQVIVVAADGTPIEVVEKAGESEPEKQAK